MFQHALRCSLVLVLALGPAAAQSRRVSACKRAAAVVVKPAPKLEYPCGAENDWDEKQLKSPERVAALKDLMSQLSTLADQAWWETSVADLNACDFKGEPGAFTDDERQQFVAGYVSWLFGNSQIRLLLLPDPCYQTQYGGANAFILSRKGNQVAVSQVLDGYFTRADNSVSLNFGKLANELVIEIATGSGGLNPTLTNYYFVIDPVTNRAVPKKLFASKHGPTNQVTSAMPFNDGPGNAGPLNIIRRQAFARSFSVYTDNGRRLSRSIKRWNGKLYR